MSGPVKREKQHRSMSIADGNEWCEDNQSGWGDRGPGAALMVSEDPSVEVTFKLKPEA